MLDSFKIKEIVVYIRYALLSGFYRNESMFSFIAYIVGSCIAFIFLWWAVRKVFKAIISATTKGKSKI